MARVIASVAAAVPISAAESEASPPPNFPIGVLTAETINTDSKTYPKFTQTVFNWVYESKAAFPKSRPKPDILYPPKGAAAS